MEELSDRGHVVVDTYPDPFRSLPVTAHRRSDVDFHDVFGGPPRRSPMQERHQSRADSLDSYPSSRGRESGVQSWGSRRPWSGLGQWPVFGEASSPDRRSHLGDDFFSDIFPGSDPVCSSSRKTGRDPFSSTPAGSRVLSPNCPLPVRCEPFIGGSSLPVQPRCRNTRDLGITGAVPTIDNVRNDVRDIYRQSPLSRQFAHGLDSSVEVSDSATVSVENQTHSMGTSLEGYIKSNLLHFSIYRWAGNGASLSFPSYSKEGNENLSGLRRLPEVVVHRVDLPPGDDCMSLGTGPTESKTLNQDSQAPKEIIMERKDDAEMMILEDHLLGEFESKYLCSDLTEESGTHNDESEKEAVGNEDITTEVEERKGLSNGLRDDIGDLKAEQQPGRENMMDQIPVMFPCARDVPISLEDKMLGGQVKGKVKEFIKIFNHEVSPKRKAIFETQDRGFKGKDRSKSKVQDQVSSFAVKADDGMKMSTKPKEVEKLDINRNSYVQVINDSSSKRNSTLEQKSDPSHGSIGTKEDKVEEVHYEDLDGCLVEQLSQDQNEHQQTDSEQDPVQISDAKIREWSKGKEGNIRSLLSTLQYVLWPESGWKPVPLVDIIEGASVKRAYQKALLCLHPDKLQQRGAPMHEKYVADKVFDMLQEAWNQFNSVSVF